MRYLKLIAIVLTVSTALLVFPNRIPEFAGLFLLWCAFRMIQGKNLRCELLAIPIWLLFKWPEPTLSFALFVAAVVVVAVWQPEKKAGRWITVGLVTSSWLAWLVQHHAGGMRATENRHPSGPIVCLGDSLTDYGYPDELRNQIDRDVQDFGFNGYTTVDGLQLVSDIVALQPHTVVIELGGHDFKNGETRSETESNIREMIERFEECGASVLLVEIPRGFINDPWYGLERQLAREYDLDLVPDTMIRRLVFWSPIIPPGSWVPESWRLSKDGLHPNDSGNRMMAKKIAGYLER